MAHRKREYEAAGHEVTIQQVNEGGSVSAWIDGYAAYAHDAMEYITQPDTEGGLTISNKIDTLHEDGEEWGAIETLMGFMADTDVYFCRKCETFYDYNNVNRTGFAGHQCGDCARDQAHCPDNPDGDTHEDNCLNPRQKRNAKVPTKYKCEHCGRTRQTTPTG